MRTRPSAAALLAVVAIALGGAAVHAKPPPAADIPQTVPLPADAIKRLKSGDAAGSRARSTTCACRPRRARRRSPPSPTCSAWADAGLTQAAIEPLGDTGNEGAARRWPCTRATATDRPAVARSGALAKTRGPAAVKALRASLSDPDAGVRGLAATGLGSMKAKDAVGDLFVALDHKVAEAAASIGQLCSRRRLREVRGKARAACRSTS